MTHVMIETKDSLSKAPVFVVDDVPFTARLDRHNRPAERFDVPLMEELWECSDRLDLDLSFGRAQVAMLHIGHAQAELPTEGMTLLGYVVQKILDRGGWVVLFTGGDPAKELQRSTVGKVLDAFEDQRGARFELCDYEDLDPVAIREVRELPPPQWRAESLLRREWFCSRVLERLAAAELAGAREKVISGIILLELRKIDIKRFGTLIGVSRVSSENLDSIGELVLWLEEIKSQDRECEKLPDEFSHWVGELRRRLHDFALAEVDGKSFERERSRLSHSLFGNEFANRLGPELAFVAGYWQSLEGSSEAGVEDQRESVETARRNWTDIASALRTFFERDWNETEASRGDTTEARRKRGLGHVAKMQELVQGMPNLAGGTEKEKASWLERMNDAISGIEHELGNITASCRRSEEFA